MLNEKLLKTALVGTAQSLPVPADPQEAVDFADEIFEQLTDESQFLLRIGRHSIYQAAGQIPHQIPALAIAPASHQAAWSPSFLDVFRRAMQKECQDLLPEFLKSLADNQLQVPNRFLPELFDLKLTKSDIAAVVGPRGDWLCQINPEWNLARPETGDESGNLEQLKVAWNDGTFPERLAALGSLRSWAPEIARELLAESFKKEKAENRKELIAVLEKELSDIDRSFLEQALSDRSKLVRRAAANLLARLPESKIWQRHHSRATQLLDKKDESSAFKLICTPPSEVDDLWEHDGLAVKSASQRGQRAFWTEELIAKVSLPHWEQRFSANPVQLINGILNDDYAHAVISGWTRALHQFQGPGDSTAWPESLWKYWSAMLKHPQSAVVMQATEQLSLMAMLMPPEKLDHLVLQIVSEQHDPTNLPITEVTSWLPGIWSKKFSHEYLKISRMLTATRSDRAVHNWLQSLSLAAVSLSPDLFQAALTPWTIRDHDVSAWQIAGIERLIANFQERIQLRLRFHLELNKVVDQ